MKHIFLSIILLISFTRICGQATNEQAVKKVVEDLLLSMKKNDAGAAANLLTDSYKMDGHSDVRCITNKEERLTSIESGRIKYGPMDFNSKANHLYILNDTTATVLVQQITITYKTCEDPSKEYTARTWVLQFIKKEGHWLLSLECIGRNCVR